MGQIIGTGLQWQPAYGAEDDSSSQPCAQDFTQNPIHSNEIKELRMNHAQTPYQSCIQACLSCATSCNQCLAACLQEEDVEMMARCISLDADCAAACSFAASAMARNSEHAKAICALCADICQSCGDECAKHEAGHCKACAAACHKCAQECRSMASAN